MNPNIPIVNPQSIEFLLNTDNIFVMIKDKFGLPPNWTRPQGFITLSKIILEQQVSLSSANAHFIKLNSYIKEFTPSQILTLSDEEMRSCQISRQKAKYLRELSKAVISGEIDFDKLPEMNHEDVRQKLMNIKGIGHWTTDIYQMFCLQSPDIFPIGDIAVVNTIRELTDAQARDEILLLSEKWKPCRSLATYFLWHYYLTKRNRTAI